MICLPREQAGKRSTAHKWQFLPSYFTLIQQLLNFFCTLFLCSAAYCKDIEKQEGYQAWIIGIVEKGNRSARIIDKPRVIEVPAKE